MRHEEEAHSADLLPVTTVHHLLADPRRRALLHLLYARDRPVAVADLARRLAALEHDGSRDTVPDDEVDRIYLSLNHVHLPKLEDVGIVEHDRDRNVAALTERAQGLTGWLESTPDE